MNEVVADTAPVEGQAAPVESAAAWTDDFSPELKGYVETKGFADAGALANSYQNLEKLHGVPAEQLVKFPADMSDLEAMSPVYTKMGRPEEATGYTNVLGEDFDSATFKAVADQAHALGLGDGQFQGLQSIMQEQSTAMVEAQEAQSVEKFDAWKAANGQGFNDAARVMADVGMGEEGIAGLLAGDKTAIYDFMAKVGAKTSEAAVIHGNAPSEGFVLSPDAAKAKIAELFGDKAFMDVYNNPSRAIRQPAIDRMEKLTKASAGG